MRISEWSSDVCASDLRAADLLPAREVGRAFGALRLRQVEMNVAVADVAEGHRADARHHRLDQRRGARDELRHPGDGHRDVVLDGAALALLRLDVAFADVPERPCLFVISPF